MVTSRARNVVVDELTSLQVAAACLQAALDDDVDAVAVILGRASREQLAGAGAAFTRMLTRNVSRTMLRSIVRSITGREAVRQLRQ